MPILQVILFSIQNSKPAGTQSIKFENETQGIVEEDNEEEGEKDLPDIFHIILDSYERQDFLKAAYDYDNTEFIQYLRNSGFYVADCSRSNYAHTFLSISSTMNMTYVQDFMTPETLSEPALKDALVHSQVRSRLEKLGYEIVAFDNVHWDYSDADIFYKFKIDPIFNPYLFPIESVYIDNSAIRIFKDYNSNFRQEINTLRRQCRKRSLFAAEIYFG